MFDLLGYGQSERHVQQEVSLRVRGDVLADLLHGTPARAIALVDAVALRPWITATTRHLKAQLDVYATMPTHIFREIAAAHFRTATARPMAAEVFATYFDQWEGEQGQQLWLRNVRGFDEQHTAEFELLLDGMHTKTRVVWGEQDRWLPVEVSAAIASRLPNADRRLLPSAGHFSPEDEPAHVAEAVADFC